MPRTVDTASTYGSPQPERCLSTALDVDTRSPGIVTGSGQSSEKTASFPERLEFLSEHEAFKYAQNRAHTFIDCMLSEHRRMSLSGEVARDR